jgi:SAM-dependent methyltransferase
MSSSSHYSKERDFWDRKGIDTYISLSEYDQNRILGWISPRPNERRRLDLGGGSGMTGRLLTANDSQILVVCMDISAKMLRHSGLPSVQGDALRLPFADNSFDLVVAAAFLHHVPGREDEVLRECVRVLAPGGRVVGYDPNARCWQNRIFMGDGFLRLSMFSPDERPIDPRLLGNKLDEAGFASVFSMVFSFRNPRLTLFEVIQRYVLDPFSIGFLRNWLQRWFFWSATKP